MWILLTPQSNLEAERRFYYPNGITENRTWTKKVRAQVQSHTSVTGRGKQNWAWDPRASTICHSHPRDFIKQYQPDIPIPPSFFFFFLQCGMQRSPGHNQPSICFLEQQHSRSTSVREITGVMPLLKGLQSQPAPEKGHRPLTSSSIWSPSISWTLEK